MAAITKIDDCRSFIRAAQLYVGVLDFFPTTLGAGLEDAGSCLDIVTVDGADVGLELLSQERREIGGLGLGDY